MRLSLLIGAAALASVSSGILQAQGRGSPLVVSVLRPENWQFGDTVAANDRDPFRIVALVLHPDGVRRILINNQSVRFGFDTENKRFSRFDTTLAPGAVTDVVTLSVITNKGDSLTRRFYTTSTKPGPDSPRLVATKPTAEIPVVVDKPKEIIVEPPVRRVCSYSGFKKRGIGYAIVGGVGIAVGAGGQKAGFGLAAAAAVVAGIDGIMSANRSECKSR